MEEIMLDGETLTLEKLEKISQKMAKVEISNTAIQKVEASRKFVDDAVERGEIIYGLTTGFGSLKNCVISKEDIEELQANLIRSHACGVGEPLSEEIVRAALLVRLNSLIRGYSGIRMVVADGLKNLINHNIYPWVPSKGSVGSSGDLAPLSHIALVLMGEGKAFVDGKLVEGKTALENAGLQSIILSYKEGLALNNGTAVMTAIAALTILKAKRLGKVADIIGAMSLEALMGTRTALRPEVHKIRPHKGQINSASNLMKLTEGSEIVGSHKHCSRVQDAYSLRCMPQVHGACTGPLEYVEEVVSIEMNSTTDNPLIFADINESMSCGNFHGEPIAIACDIMSIVISELGNISERRTAKMVDPNTSEGLPAYLISSDIAGLNNGFMIPQYVAAALVSENKILAHPASVDSIPTSANQEDHVSMGTIAARKALEIVKNVQNILAIEAMCASQALEFKRPLSPGEGSKAAYEFIRKFVLMLGKDRVMYDDMEQISQIIGDGSLIEIVEKVTGELK